MPWVMETSKRTNFTSELAVPGIHSVALGAGRCVPFAKFTQQRCGVAAPLQCECELQRIIVKLGVEVTYTHAQAATAGLNASTAQ